MTVTYENKVRQARALAEKSEDAQWALAEMTYHVINVGEATTQRWAEDIGLSVNRVTDYLKVWDRYSDPSTRSERSFNDHVEIARVTDEKAQAIIAHAERTGVSLGIARKTISREETKRRTEERIRQEALAAAEAAREDDLAAALQDTGNALVGHQQALEDTRKQVVESRARGAAAEATKPFIAAAAATKVYMIPSAARSLLESVQQANSLDLEIDRLDEVMRDLRAAVAEVEFHAAKRGLNIGSSA